MTATQSSRTLSQHLLTSLGQFVLIIFQSFLSFVQFAFLLGMLFFQTIEA